MSQEYTQPLGRDVQVIGRATTSRKCVGTTTEEHPNGSLETDRKQCMKPPAQQ